MLIGVEKIKTTLNSIITQTKAKAIIVTDSLSWLDTSKIPSKPVFTIIVDPDILDKEDMEILKILKSLPNLGLRKLDKNRYKMGIEQIMIIRDGEEIIFSKSLRKKNPDAIHSTDEFFVNLFSDIFNPFMTMLTMDTMDMKKKKKGRFW